ncbi:MAG: chromosome segregation protein SMC [Candidatus Woesearchaeota archaeon]|jgi:chromosome segregation protein
MTKVLRMEMRGFKSFAKKTEIPFTDSFNCILGPNGSGKSNILDALCFVLGKAGSKGLRAEKTANLIYNGGKTKTPAKDGEVSIFFDNTNKEFNAVDKEIKITRIIKGNGQSIYKLNNKSVTRTQILDVLSKANINPDGYNIILQGDIVRLIEMSSIERRQIVEEIAGISVYEDKKQKALRELQRVDSKISEADIILAERKAHLKELKSDRDKAMKFKDLDTNIKRNKATIISKELDDKKNKIIKFEKETSLVNKEIEKIEKEIHSRRLKIEELKLQIDEINAEIERKGEKDQVALNKEVEKLKVDVALNKQRITNLLFELEKIVNRRKELNENFKDIEGKLTILDNNKKELESKIKIKESDILRIEKKIAEFKQKNKIENAVEMDKQIEEMDKKIELAQEEVAKLRDSQQQVLRDKDKNDAKLQTIDEKMSKVLSIEKENKDALEKLKQMKLEFKKATIELSQALSEDSSIAMQLSTANSKLTSRKEELSKYSARLVGLREQMGGSQAIRDITDLNLKGVYGLLSELGDVSSEHSLSLEVAAGQRLKSMVVDTDETAAKCINHLKKTRSGVATFIPLNKIRTSEIDSNLRKIKNAGVVGLAMDLISFDKKYEKAFNFVFGNTLVVKDIESARQIGVGTVRMVTLTGDLVETSGAMQGGFRQKTKESGFMEKESKDAMKLLNSEIADLETIFSRLIQTRKDNEELITRLREFKANIEGDIIKMEKSLRLDSEDLESGKTEKGKIRKEIDVLDKQAELLMSQVSKQNSALVSLKMEKQKFRDQINQLRSPALLAELTSYDQKRVELRSEISELILEIKGTDSEKQNILGPERENIMKIFKQLDKEEKDFSEEKKILEKLISEQEKDLAEKEEKVKKFYAQFKELFNKRNKTSDDVNKTENEILKENELMRKNEQKIAAQNIESAGVKAQVAGLEEEFKLYDGVQTFKNKPIEEIRKEIADFEKMLQNIGTVNMRALEIYDSVEKEYTKLTEKKAKLSSEKENVLLMINEVDGKKKELFMKTYDVVNHNFKEVFTTLSSKGTATLDLEDKNDPFNGGLNIKVKLVGNKYMDIRSLSGGEKTMTALAFIFAVQEHEPAAFYVLDEVDAALDKKNSERLAKLVNEYSKRAQYIMISHNDNVITEATTLYGISMNEHGESKVTSLKI